MLKTWVALASALFFLASSVCSPAPSPAEPLFVSGTHRKESHFTEPRPHRSQFLETISAGILIIGERAGFYLFARVIKSPPKELHIIAEYENPSGGPPFRNKMPFKPDTKELKFSSPDFVRGLQINVSYKITIKIFDAPDGSKPIDTLKQALRSYVDSRESTLKVYKKLQRQ